MNPRYSFKCKISDIAKLVKKTWPCVEDLIFEKPRRKSSAQSKKSSDHSHQNNIRNRINSMEENSDQIDSKMQFGHQEHPAELNESSNPIVKRNPKHRVDDPIDEQEEIDNEIKNNKKKNKGHK